MRNRVGNILWGLAFILVGIGFTGNVFNIWDFHLFFNGWWTLFIIVPCTISMIKNGVNVGNIIGLGIGVLFLLSAQDIVQGVYLGKLIFPLILIVIGLGFILRNGGGSNRHYYGTETIRAEGDNSYDTVNDAHNKRYSNHSYNDIAGIFGSRRENFDGRVFDGANINSVFGSVVLDLREAILEGEIVLEVTAVFGGVDIIVPPNVKIKVSSMPIFGGVSNRTSSVVGQEKATIYINATSMFGGIDIR